MIKLGRDPFARTTTIRKTFFCTGLHDCDWCGNLNTTPKDRPFLYRYFIEHDGIRTIPLQIKGAFCSIQCCRSYHGE